MAVNTVSNLVHLHVHSDFSLQDAISRPEAMAKRLKELDQHAIALTDHGTMSGIAIFENQLKKHNVKLIAGCELYVAQLGADDTTKRDTAHITLLAMNMEGYRNLSKLHTMSWQRPAYYFNPRTDLDLIGDYSAGLIALTGCLGGVLLKPLHAGNENIALANLKKLKQIFGPRLFMELQDHEIEYTNDAGALVSDADSLEWLRRQAKTHKIDIVATNDTHYVNKSDWVAHDMIVAAGKGEKIGGVRHIEYKAGEFHIKSYDEMRERFGTLELKNTMKIANMCEPLKLESKVFHLPMVEKQGLKALRRIAIDGLEHRYHTDIDSLNIDHPEVIERFEYELKAIDKGGFTQYLLLMHDMYEFMKREKIPYGLGRGSAAASIVCYALGITGVDPLEYNLLFERFINPDRVSAPDIDCDISAIHRGRVIAYLKERWGNDKVVQIVTFGTLGARAAIRDMARVLGKPPWLADKLAKLVPANGSLTTDRESRHYLDEALKNVKELKKLYESDSDAEEIINAAREVEGVIRQASLHAAGIVISDKPVAEYAPLLTAKETSKSEDRPIGVAYGMNELENLGLIKFDLLGLKTLDTVAECVNWIIADGLLPKGFDINEISLDDPKTYSLLGSGLTAGVFQFECVAGDTILNGDPRKTIAQLFIDQPKRMTSIDLGEGKRRVNNVLKVVQSGNKQLYRLNTEHNYTLRATREHKVLTERGWLKIVDIQVNDKIVVNSKDASRIGACKDCGDQIKSRADRCHSCANKLRDSAGLMLANLDKDSWLKNIKRGDEHVWWGGHPRTVSMVFDDLDHPVASKWEADFARYLKATKVEYQYEPKTFKFSDGSGYTPDFYLPFQNIWIEVKGKSGLCGRGKTKVDRFRREFPEESITVVTAHQIAEYELANPKLAKWSCPTLPSGFNFERVTSITKDKVEMTYDVAMQAPLNNYIANGIVVHNSNGMAGWLRKLKPDNIEDLIAMVALYRPGPMAFIETYIDRKHRKADLGYPDDRLEPALKSTYGIAVFQEQLMQISQIVAGWSLSRADQLRKVIGKKIIDKIAGERKQFADDAAKNGYDWEFADDLFENFIEPAARYSFNKGHATVYGVLAYQTAWLKANYPVYYFGCLLTSVADDNEKTGNYISDARALGIAVLAPDVNESNLGFTAVKSIV